MELRCGTASAIAVIQKFFSPPLSKLQVKASLADVQLKEIRVRIVAQPTVQIRWLTQHIDVGEDYGVDALIQRIMLGGITVGGVLQLAIDG